MGKVEDIRAYAEIIVDLYFYKLEKEIAIKNKLIGKWVDQNSIKQKSIEFVSDDLVLFIGFQIIINGAFSYSIDAHGDSFEIKINNEGKPICDFCLQLFDSKTLELRSKKSQNIIRRNTTKASDPIIGYFKKI